MLIYKVVINVLFKKIKNTILRIGLNMVVYSLLGILVILLCPYLAVVGFILMLVMYFGLNLVFLGVIMNIVNHFEAKKRKNNTESGCCDIPSQPQD